MLCIQPNVRMLQHDLTIAGLIDGSNQTCACDESFLSCKSNCQTNSYIATMCMHVLFVQVTNWVSVATHYCNRCLKLATDVYVSDVCYNMYA